MIKKEFAAKNVELAIEAGLKELAIEKEQAEIEIVDNGGFLKKARVLMRKKPTDGQKAQEFVEELVEKMKISCVVDLEETDESCVIDLKTTETGALIGYRGDVLDSIQYLASLVCNTDKDSFKRIVVDCEGYRAKREQSLAKLAFNLAKKATKLQKVVELEPMNPYERRIIHATLQDDKFVYTKSKGEDSDRHVIIIPKGRKTDRPSGERGERSDSNRNRNFNNRDRDNNGERRERNNDRPRNPRPSNTDAPKKTTFSFGTYLGKAEPEQEKEQE